MKKYNNSFICYGQSVAGRINYHQKMGVARGIILTLKHKMRSMGLRLGDYQTCNPNNLLCLTDPQVTVALPVKETKWVYGEYPIFKYDGKIAVVDMLHFDDELSLHVKVYNSKTESYENKGWHTIRECFTLEQTCTLFEYVEDVINEIVVLPPGESDIE